MIHVCVSLTVPESNDEEDDKKSSVKTESSQDAKKSTIGAESSKTVEPKTTPLSKLQQTGSRTYSYLVVILFLFVYYWLC